MLWCIFSLIESSAPTLGRGSPGRAEGKVLVGSQSGAVVNLLGKQQLP